MDINEGFVLIFRITQRGELTVISIVIAGIVNLANQ